VASRAALRRYHTRRRRPAAATESDTAALTDAALLLRAVVATNPQLKSTLTNVVLTTTPPDGIGIDVALHTPHPEGSSYDAAARKLTWRVSEELVRDTPVPCTATLCADGGAEALPPEEALPAAFQGVPFHVQFGCEGVTISGIELEVQLVGGAATPSPS